MHTVHIVFVQVGWPDHEGRRQILNIHTKQMLEHDLLSRADWQGNSGLVERLVASTAGFSGAELAGLVRAASSHAIARHLEGSVARPV